MIGAEKIERTALVGPPILSSFPLCEDFPTRMPKLYNEPRAVQPGIRKIRFVIKMWQHTA